MRRRAAGSAVALAAALACAAALAAAETLYTLPRRDLDCSADFPCPAELQRRIDFWISIFGEHGDDRLVLHDASQPERVFSVLTTEANCSRRRPARVVTRERDRVQGVLEQVARTRGGAGEAKWNAEERHLAAIFEGESAAEVRASARRIRCQEGNRHRFLEGLKRYGGYRDMVVQTLRAAALPSDLQYLPFVESSYNPEARSHVGAAGLWQIMPRTGRILGLAIDASVDERIDPERATRAAARYLIDSRQSLSELAQRIRPGVSEGEVNPFVVTSYNYGLAGMTRAMRQHGPDFVQVLERYRGRSFRVAVKNFYASFLAARYVAQNATKFFGTVQVDPPLRYDAVTLEAAASVAALTEHLGVSREELERLNPALSRHVWRGRRYVPRGYELRLPVRPEGWDEQLASLRAAGRERLALGDAQYRVQPGDTACGIARDFGVSCQLLIDENLLGRRALIRVGQVLTIPGAGPAPVASSGPVEAGEYRVRRGDSACGIARRHGVDCRELLRANGLGGRAVIYPGQVLQIPGAARAADASGGTEYRVRRGDTACSIARRHRVSCDSLLSANGLGRRTTIYVGQTLTIPTGGE